MKLHAYHKSDYKAGSMTLICGGKWGVGDYEHAWPLEDPIGAEKFRDNFEFCPKCWSREKKCPKCGDYLMYYKLEEYCPRCS